MNDRIKLGAMAKDKITGFTGIVFAITHYLTGCDHVGVKPRELNEKGEIKEIKWFDAPLLEVTSKPEEGLIILDMDGTVKPGGPAEHSFKATL